MDTTTYTALCERAGRWWTIRVPQVEGLMAQVRSLDQAEMMARQSIVRTLGVPPESVVVEVIPEAAPSVGQALQARQTAKQAFQTAVKMTAAALDTLAQDGWLFHDAATMLGLSDAEIAQYGHRYGRTPGTEPAASPGPVPGRMAAGSSSSTGSSTAGPLEMAGQ